MEPLGENQFRLLHLLPGNRNEPLRCELHAASFDNHPPYEALSYVWGSSTDRVDIEVAGKRQSITTSVEAILLRLRLPWRAQLLWIDQLCINQSNEEERNAQVKRMGDIYSQCTQCLVWLSDLADGTRLEDAEAAIAVIKYIAAFDPKKGNSTSTPPACMASDNTFKLAMKALGTIRPRRCQWWHRVWTLQEAFLPNDLAFLWGPLAFSLSTALKAGVVWRQRNSNGLRPACISRTQIDIALREADLENHMNTLKRIKTRRRNPDGLLPGVVKYRTRVATDPRDNVYALLGLFKHANLPLSRECNYKLSVNQVFINFTLDLLRATGRERPTLKALVLDPWRKDNALPGLPRWAIDMRSEPPNGPGIWRSFWFYHAYEANKGLPDTGRLECQDQGLRLPGVLVDTVIDVARERFSTPREDMISWWNLYCNDKSNHLTTGFPQTTPTNCKKYDTFCRLVLGDWLENRHYKPETEATDQDWQNVSEFLGMNRDHRDTKRHIGKQLMNRRFFITQKEFIGLGHLETEPGDEVWVFNHGLVPFTVRPRGGPASPSGTEAKDCDFVGHCYVQGIMQGLGDDERVDRKQRQVRLY